MREGYTLAWLGWDLTAASGNNRLTITLPVATQPDGAPIVGPAMEEFMIDNATTLAGELTYPAASLDTTRARLTARARRADARTPVPADAWEYASPRSIRLLPAGTPFQQGMLYELVYPATEPRVAGLGFAATRDFVTFLRGASRDDAGTANPLAGRLAAAYAFGISQGGRYLRDLLYLGFNRDEAGRQFIPLRPTKAERLAVGDPRSSIEERYPTHASYVGQVARAAYRLVRGRLLLEEDAQRLVEAAVDKRLVGGH